MKEYTLQDLRRLPTSEPPQYIIDGLLRTRRGRPSILGGFDHVGKSTIAQQMAKCVAKGEPFLSRSTCQGKVLYFQTEESVEDAKIDFLKNMPDENEGIVVLHPDNPKNNFEELKGMLDKHPDTVFVIIETLMDFFGIRDVKDNDECRALLQKFCDEICKKYENVSFLFLHWMRKTDATELSKGLMRHRLLGGTAIAAKMDTLIYLHQVSDTDPRRLILAETRKGKNIEATYLTFNSETQHAELGHTLAEEKTADKIKISTNAKLAKDSECIWYVRHHQGQPKTTAAKGVGGKYADTLTRFDNLISEKKLIEIPAGEKNAMLLYTPDAVPVPKLKYCADPNHCVNLAAEGSEYCEKHVCDACGGFSHDRENDGKCHRCRTEEKRLAYHAQQAQTKQTDQTQTVPEVELQETA